MNNLSTRNLIIDLLDDEHGINDPAYATLYDLACETENEDVVTKATAINGRWFLGEDDAEELRSNL
jgi:hypothetical protein